MKQETPTSKPIGLGGGSSLIIISILFFLMGYAFLTNKAENLLMWSLTGEVEKIKDKEGYKKQQGKQSIVMGVIFLCVPISIYFIDKFHLNEKLLYLWLFILAGVVIGNSIQVRKYFNDRRL